MFRNRRHGCCQYERSKTAEQEDQLDTKELVELLKKDYLTHGINVSVNEDNKITIDFHVIVSYGVSISTVTDNLIETVRYKVEEFTGMEIEKINIYVEGVRVID